MGGIETCFHCVTKFDGLNWVQFNFFSDVELINCVFAADAEYLFYSCWREERRIGGDEFMVLDFYLNFGYH